VLAVLALSRRPIPRDTLLGLFWAETETTKSRFAKMAEAAVSFLILLNMNCLPYS